MEKIVEVKTCKSCQFWQTTMDGMECGHPYWKGKGVYANMIIYSPHYLSGIPEKCPLRIEELTLTVTYKLK